MSIVVRETRTGIVRGANKRRKPEDCGYKETTGEN